MNNLFKEPDGIPKEIGSVPIYKTTNTFDKQKDLNKRIKNYASMFNMKSKFIDYGERLLLKNNKFNLFVYKQSDSFLLYPQNFNINYPKKKINLPTKEEACQIAINYLKELKLTNEYAEITTVKYTKVASLKSLESPSLLAINIIFSFNIDHIPAMGPGAKIKVTIIQDGKINGLVYFWRDISKEDDTIGVISPKEALKRFKADKSFNQLNPETDSVIIKNIQFGYYSLSPTDYQRYLIPVYALKGSVETKYANYNFVDYIVAAKISPLKIKTLRVVDNPFPCFII